MRELRDLLLVDLLVFFLALADMPARTLALSALLLLRCLVLRSPWQRHCPLPLALSSLLTKVTRRREYLPTAGWLARKESSMHIL